MFVLHDSNRNRGGCCPVKTTCPAANRDIQSTFSNSFDLKILRNGISDQTSLIIAQWHGTPSGHLLRDALGCVAKVSFEDYNEICCSSNKWFKVCL